MSNKFDVVDFEGNDICVAGNISGCAKFAAPLFRRAKTAAPVPAVTERYAISTWA